MEISFELNGRPERIDVAPLTPLADVLRDTLLQTGTKVACGEGFCGACTVHLDGRPAVACLVPAALVDGRAVTTIEGVAAGEALHPVQQALHPVQQALLDHDAVQCGMCFPGMVMSLIALIDARGPELDELQVRDALVGNVCRCTGYQGIVAAALAAAEGATRRSGPGLDRSV